MPRKPRRFCSTKVYHCILRGINRQDIFLDKEDFLKFKKLIKNTKNVFSYKLYSYVLMSNHIHLHIKDDKDNISKIMQSLEVSYVNYFNKKYNRVGHLFQDRFKSRCVENSSYCLNLIRYIHQNPVKAGIGNIDNYEWSSYLEYINRSKDILTDKEEMLLLFSKDKEKSLNNFIKFNNEIFELNESECILEYEIKKTLNDLEVIECIKKVLNINNIEVIQNYNKKRRNECLKKIKQIKGCTKNQLSRILGIPVRIVQRA